MGELRIVVNDKLHEKLRRWAGLHDQTLAQTCEELLEKAMEGWDWREEK